jgi:hypothetical protein
LTHAAHPVAIVGLSGSGGADADHQTFASLISSEQCIGDSGWPADGVEALAVGDLGDRPTSRARLGGLAAYGCAESST